MRALVIVDVQYDFCPGGPLGTERGDDVAEAIGAYQLAHADDYAAQVTTQDWHIQPKGHFSEDPDFTDTWPKHCLANTRGAELHRALHPELATEMFRKGEFTPAYSGFEGIASGPVAHPHLGEWLRDHGVTDLDVVGIATDFCVRATVLDGLREGFKVRVLQDKVAAVTEEGGQKALQELQQAGAELA